MIAERIGEFLLNERAITVEQLGQALEIQKQRDPKPFLGDILLEEGVIDAERFQVYLRKYLLQLGRHLPSEGLMIGNLLVMVDIISQSELEEALGLQESEGPRKRFLGEILVDEGFITLHQLETLLFNQQMLREGKQPTL
jgi:hypothetical protein